MAPHPVIQAIVDFAAGAIGGSTTLKHAAATVTYVARRECSSTAVLPVSL